jgi:hypothetical protein
MSDKLIHPPQPRRHRPLLEQPPDITKAFPERSRDWGEDFPALIKPWVGGVRAYWIVQLQAFYLTTGNVVRVNGFDPETDVNLLGEFNQKNKSYVDLLRQVMTNQPEYDLSFAIFDVELPERNASERSEWLSNELPTQHDRGNTILAQMFLVGKDSSFNQWLNTWQSYLYPGTLVVGAEDPWLATEYEVTEPV